MAQLKNTSFVFNGSLQGQLLGSNVKRFRGGLVFKAHGIGRRDGGGHDRGDGAQPPPPPRDRPSPAPPPPGHCRYLKTATHLQTVAVLLFFSYTSILGDT